MSFAVVVADDQPLVRAGFRVILESEPDIRVVAEAADGAEAVRVVRDVRPDVVLMDIRMPHVNGIDATRRIKELGISSRILILTTFDLDEYVYQALRAGATGFLLKDVTRDELVRAVRLVAAGDALLAPSVTQRLIAEFTRRRLPDSAAVAAVGRLSDREREVLRLLAEGLSNTELAERLVLSTHTVKTHVASILAKLGVRDRVQAVIAAYESGLARGDD
jgi:DNA-binding NarL/FixJ family response regulator